MPPKKAQPPIRELRLKSPGYIPGQASVVVRPALSQILSWHPLGVLVQQETRDILVPWGAIASVTLQHQPEKTKQAKTSGTDEPARSSAGAARAGTSARTAPGR